MGESPDNLNDSQRLRSVAAQSRFQSIMTQLSFGSTLCTMADTELLYNHVGVAHELIQKLQHLVQTVRSHLDEPNYVSSDRVDLARQELAKLEKRIATIEARLVR